MRELERLLPELAPPPGGLARLQRSLRAQGKSPRRHPWRWLPALAALSALALALAWLPGFVNRERATDALTQTMLQATTTTPLPDGIHVEHGAALLLTSGPADAHVYLIASTSPTKR